MLRLTRAQLASWVLSAHAAVLATPVHAQPLERAPDAPAPNEPTPVEHTPVEVETELRITPGSSASRGGGASFGAGVQAALAEGVAKLCGDPMLAAWLTSTCASASEGSVTPARLREVALLDLVAWVARLSNRVRAGDASDSGLRRDLWVLDVALQGGRPAALASSLRARVEQGAPCERAPDPVACRADRAHAEAELARELSTLAPDAQPERAALTLVAVLEHHSTAMLTPAQQSTAVPATAEPRSASTRVANLTVAVARADLAGLVAALSVYAEAASGATVGGGAPVAAVATLVALLDARDEAQLRRRLLALAIEVPSWIDGLVLDAGAGVPVLESGRLQVTGRLVLGYQWERYGFELRGSIAEYEVDQPAVFWDLRRWQGGASGFHRLSLGDVDLEVGIDGGVLLYDSSFVPYDLAPGELLDENSLVVRGGAAADARYEASRSVVIRASVGLGMQFESYDRVTNLSGEPEFLRAQDNVDLQGEVRAALGWRVWPSVLRLRLSTDATIFSRTVNRVAVADVADPDVRRSSETVVEIDNDTQLAVDFSAAELAGFAPVVYTQASTVQLFAASRSQAVVVFSFGLGISRVLL